ncbi:hypothetical protein DY000_02040318 [Brassica cretica]|uniref:Uncharacterized protein n=1 Tax=Brassica cretica TaxID=69181 RepID=A0ABQ7BEF9_BRACR|nr:hypothetical protein DY000_02040318 [Brassica cretica]
MITGVYIGLVVVAATHSSIVGFLLDGGNSLGLVGDNQTWKDLQESKRQKREKREGGRISSGFVKADLEGQTDPDRADILWEASSVMKLVVTVLQQCCLECLVNPTVRSSLIELKFGRGVVDWFILDLYGGISLWFP